MKDDVFGLLDSIRSRESIKNDMIANMETLKQTLASVEAEITNFRGQLQNLCNYRLSGENPGCVLTLEVIPHKTGELVVLMELEDRMSAVSMRVRPDDFFQFCAWGCELAGWKVEQR